MGFHYLNLKNHTNLISPTTTLTVLAILSSSYYMFFHLQKNNKNKNCNKKLKESTNEEENQSNKKCIYLDYNGTTPIHPKVYKSMIPYLTEHYGNPSSSHYYGTEPKKAITNSRMSIAKYLYNHSNVQEQDNDSNKDEIIKSISSNIIFTGCGTESNNLAIYLAIKSYQQGNNDDNDKHTLPHVITTNVEHPAITQCLKYYEHTNQITITYIPVDKQCMIINPKHIEEAITKTTCLITIMYANNEIGTIYPIYDIAEKCKTYNNGTIIFHTDAAQGIGKTNQVQMNNYIDMITIVGHKIGAPKGISALYVRKDCLNNNDNNNIPYLVGESGGILLGGGQEFGYRGGTENVPYIVGLGKAIDIITQQEQQDNNGNNDDCYNHYRVLIKTLLNLLIQNIGEENILLHGPPITNINQRLSNTISIGIKDIHSGLLLYNLKDLVAASSGSACHSSLSLSSCDDNNASYSNILKVMNVPLEYALGTIRLSVGFDTTLDDVKDAAIIISNEVHRLWMEQELKK